MGVFSSWETTWTKFSSSSFFFWSSSSTRFRSVISRFKSALDFAQETQKAPATGIVDCGWSLFQSPQALLLKFVIF